MKLKKIAALVMTAAMAVSMMACGGSQSTATTESKAESAAESVAEESKAESAAESAAESVAEESAAEATEEAAAIEGITPGRTVKVGTAGNNEPYSLVASDGTWTGIESELWDEIVKRTGWTMELVHIPDMAALFGELGTGRIDVAANCWAITEARLETYLASDPIYADAQVIVVKADSEANSFDDLKGKRIGVTAGQAAQNTIEEMAPDYDWEVVTYEDTNAGLQDCSLGRVDCYAHTVTTIRKAEMSQGLSFKILEPQLFGNNVGWFFQDNDEGKALRDEMNIVLAEMQADGTVSKIVSKWFNEDATKLISDDFLKANK